MTDIFDGANPTEELANRTPHTNKTDVLYVETYGNCWWDCYHAYNAQFNYDEWYPYLQELLPPVHIITVKSTDIAVLREICHIKLYREVDIYDKLDDLSGELRKQLREFIEKYTELFVKTNKTSGKNYVPLTPKVTVADVIDLLTSQCFLTEYEPRSIERPFSIIVMPWNNSIKSDYEFRVIIHNYSVRGIAQQRWYSMCSQMYPNIVHIAQQIIKYYQEQVRNRLPYPDVVLDLWVDPTDNFSVHLIECNPGGLYATSGSSLFSWIRDYNLLCTDDYTGNPAVALIG